MVAGPTGPLDQVDVVEPYRPRPRVLRPPVGAALARVLQLTDAVGATAPAHELLTLEPAAAADRILLALAEWGYRTP